MTHGQANIKFDLNRIKKICFSV